MNSSRIQIIETHFINLAEKGIDKGFSDFAEFIKEIKGAAEKTTPLRLVPYGQIRGQLNFARTRTNRNRLRALITQRIIRHSERPPTRKDIQISHCAQGHRFAKKHKKSGIYRTQYKE